jgi:F-box interacting protein
MSLLFGLRRVLSHSFNTLIRRRSFTHRHFTTQSPTSTGRVLFVSSGVNQLPERGLQYFYSAKIIKGGTLGHATTLSPIPFKSWDGGFQFCNGLILFPVHSQGQLHILCPDTGEVSTLPEAPQPLLYHYQDEMDFECYHFQFLGFDSLSNKHKVLLVQKPLVDNIELDSIFWIFTLGSGAWREIAPDAFRRNFISLISSFANGALHWIDAMWEYYDEGKDCWIFEERWILSFDMATEQFRMIRHPVDSFHDSFRGYLAEFGGRLAWIEDLTVRKRHSSRLLEGNYVFEDEDYDKLQCWVLEEEDYNNHKWVKETIRFPFAWMANHKFLAFNNNTGEMLLKPVRPDSFFWQEQVECLLFYNTKTGIFRSTNIDKEEDCNLCVVDATLG